MKKNERLHALLILQKLLAEKIPLTYLLQADSETSPLTKAICYGVCRHYVRLQLIADSLISKRPQGMDVWLAILIGLYQLQFLDKPNYASVQETVSLLDKLKKSWAKGLVNAVLRRFCRERELIMPAIEKELAYQHGHPQWLISCLQHDWPHHWQDIVQRNDEHPPMSLRVNQRHISRDAYLEQLQNAGIGATKEIFSPVGILLNEACDVQELPGFAAGDVSVQDEAAQLAVSLLALKPGLTVLDACCAPGGKTCHILETEPQLASCIALDVDGKRLARVQENLNRLQLSATLKQGDGLNPATWWDGQLFDRILLDAPCSATGVIRRHPDIKLLRTHNDIKQIAELQSALLQSVWSLLKPGGLLVYATCSVMSIENDDQIASFLQQHSDSQFVDNDNAWGIATGHGWQILPGQNNCDGFFYSCLIKRD